MEDLAERGRNSWLILTGCRKGLVRQALEFGGYADGPEAAGRELDRLVSLFGKDRVVVELIDHHLGRHPGTGCWPVWPRTTGSR